MSLGENWKLQCQDCARYSPDPDKNICKMINHKTIKHSRPYFSSEICGAHSPICPHFEPRQCYPYLINHYSTYEEEIKNWLEIWHNHKYYGGDDGDVLGFFIGEDDDTIYKVRLIDWLAGDIYNSNGELNWIYKEYPKRQKSPDGTYHSPYIREYNENFERKR